ncbi:hypothetical protein PR048_002700 [Dryococelus australis]|uniref:Uncharacterized protein n=1 Tax=Dryococelus australis TaxID=614101 RepID=A0ABQ9IMD8_9NEOP|nr:hypothetical protein PR048_002700 [Dryococelus australis]
MKGRENGRSPRKPADQRHRPPRFPHAKIRWHRLAIAAPYFLYACEMSCNSSAATDGNENIFVWKSGKCEGIFHWKEGGNPDLSFSKFVTSCGDACEKLKGLEQEEPMPHLQQCVLCSTGPYSTKNTSPSLVQNEDGSDPGPRILEFGFRLLMRECRLGWKGEKGDIRERRELDSVEVSPYPAEHASADWFNSRRCEQSVSVFCKGCVAYGTDPQQRLYVANTNVVAHIVPPNHFPVHSFHRTWCPVNLLCSDHNSYKQIFPCLYSNLPDVSQQASLSVSQRASCAMMRRRLALPFSCLPSLGPALLTITVAGHRPTVCGQMTDIFHISLFVWWWKRKERRRTAVLFRESCCVTRGSQVEFADRGCVADTNLLNPALQVRATLAVVAGPRALHQGDPGQNHSGVSRIFVVHVAVGTNGVLRFCLPRFAFRRGFSVSPFHPRRALTTSPLKSGMDPRVQVQEARELAENPTFSIHSGATVAERLARSPPTMANRVQYPARSWIFASGIRAGRSR